MSNPNSQNLLGDGQVPLHVRFDIKKESPGLTEGKSTSVQNFQSLIKSWEEQRNVANFDPTDILEEMADLLEKVR